MDKSKFLNKKNNRNDGNELKKFIVSFVSKCLVSIAIFLLLLIISNKNINICIITFKFINILIHLLNQLKRIINIFSYNYFYQY